MTKKKINVKLLRKIERHIQEEPLRLYMPTWVYHFEDVPCGTAGCIAGWAVMLNDPKIKNAVATDKPIRSLWALDSFWGRMEIDGRVVNIESRAKKLLGLSEVKAKRLFDVANWPYNFYAQMSPFDSTPRQRAKATIQRIEKFIKTNGKE